MMHSQRIYPRRASDSFSTSTMFSETHWITTLALPQPDLFRNTGALPRSKINGRTRWRLSPRLLGADRSRVGRAAGCAWRAANYRPTTYLRQVYLDTVFLAITSWRTYRRVRPRSYVMGTDYPFDMANNPIGHVAGVRGWTSDVSPDRRWECLQSAGPGCLSRRPGQRLRLDNQTAGSPFRADEFTATEARLVKCFASRVLPRLAGDFLQGVQHCKCGRRSDAGYAFHGTALGCDTQAQILTALKTKKSPMAVRPPASFIISGGCYALSRPTRARSNAQVIASHLGQAAKTGHSC